MHPAHSNLHPACCNNINVTRTKISHVIGQFSKIWVKKFKFSILTQNWHRWYLGGANSKPGFNFLKFRPKNPIFGLKNSKLSVLPRSWHTWYLEDADSYSKISFLNLQPYIHFGANLVQKSQLSDLYEIWYLWYLEDADSYSDISFLNFKT